MSSRQLPSAATKKILPALVFLAASGLSPLAAQTQDGTSAQEAPVPQSTAPLTAPVEPLPDTGAVFDAPNMPGVRMMAPIPDSLAPSADIAPRTTTLAPIPASVAPPPPASGKQAA